MSLTCAQIRSIRSYRRKQKTRVSNVSAHIRLEEARMITNKRERERK